MAVQSLGKLCIAIVAFVTLVTSVSIARAETPEGFDLSTTLLARTYSPGLSLNPTAGFGQRVWGDPMTPWYGFVRPHLDGVISSTLYEARAGLEVFPVSILGLNLARTYGRRYTNTNRQDCIVAACQGELDYTDFTVQSYLGGAGYFSSIRWTRTFFDAAKDRSRPIYDVGSSVLLKADGESADYLTVAVGKDLNEDISVGVLIQKADFRSSGNHQEAQYAIVKSDLKWMGFDDLSATAGIGRFKSDLNVGEFSVILSVTYTTKSAIGFGR